MTKETLRTECRERLKKISPVQRFEASIQAANILQASMPWRQSQVVMLYAAMSSEMDASPIIQAAWDSGRAVCLPRMTEEKHKMEIRFLTTLDRLIPGKLGILEPDPKHCPVMELPQIDLMIVPGLGFDRAGNRLGRGAGYYDALLALPERKATAIGYFFSCQELSSVPQEKYDQTLDWIVTEKEIFRL